jgi:flagellar protein FlgJ
MEMMDGTTLLPNADVAKERAFQQKLNGYSRQAAGMSGAQIDKAAQEYEAMFLSQMLGHMLKPTNLPEPFGGGHAEEMFHSLLVDEYARVMSESGGIGIASHVKRELLSMQEVTP